MPTVKQGEFDNAYLFVSFEVKVSLHMQKCYHAWPK